MILYDYWDEARDTRCVLGTLAEMIRGDKLRPEMLLAFEEEVISEAWQNTQSVFHFFYLSETLNGMLNSLDVFPDHSCTIRGTIIIHRMCNGVCGSNVLFLRMGLGTLESNRFPIAHGKQPIWYYRACHNV